MKRNSKKILLSAILSIGSITTLISVPVILTSCSITSNSLTLDADILFDRILTSTRTIKEDEWTSNNKILKNKMSSIIIELSRGKLHLSELTYDTTVDDNIRTIGIKTKENLDNVKISGSNTKNIDIDKDNNVIVITNIIINNNNSSDISKHSIDVNTNYLFDELNMLAYRIVPKNWNPSNKFLTQNVAKIIKNSCLNELNYFYLTDKTTVDGINGTLCIKVRKQLSNYDISFSGDYKNNFSVQTNDDTITITNLTLYDESTPEINFSGTQFYNEFFERFYCQNFYVKDWNKDNLKLQEICKDTLELVIPELHFDCLTDQTQVKNINDGKLVIKVKENLSKITVTDTYGATINKENSTIIIDNISLKIALNGQQLFDSIETLTKTIKMDDYASWSSNNVKLQNHVKESLLLVCPLLHYKNIETAEDWTNKKRLKITIFVNDDYLNDVLNSSNFHHISIDSSNKTITICNLSFEDSPIEFECYNMYENIKKAANNIESKDWNQNNQELKKLVQENLQNACPSLTFVSLNDQTKKVGELGNLVFNVQGDLTYLQFDNNFDNSFVVDKVAKTISIINLKLKDTPIRLSGNKIAYALQLYFKNICVDNWKISNGNILKGIQKVMLENSDWRLHIESLTNVIKSNWKGEVTFKFTENSNLIIVENDSPNFILNKENNTITYTNFVFETTPKTASGTNIYNSINKVTKTINPNDWNKNNITLQNVVKETFKKYLPYLTYNCLTDDTKLERENGIVTVQFNEYLTNLVIEETPPVSNFSFDERNRTITISNLFLSNSPVSLNANVLYENLSDALTGKLKNLKGITTENWRNSTISGGYEINCALIDSCPKDHVSIENGNIEKSATDNGIATVRFRTNKKVQILYYNKNPFVSINNDVIEITHLPLLDYSIKINATQLWTKLSEYSKTINKYNWNIKNEETILNELNNILGSLTKHMIRANSIIECGTDNNYKGYIKFRLNLGVFKEEGSDSQYVDFFKFDDKRLHKISIRNLPLM